jgi:hypothetical protein
MEKGKEEREKQKREEGVPERLPFPCRWALTVL